MAFARLDSFTEYRLPEGKGLGQGSVWSWPSFLDAGTHSDAWCRARTNPPAMAMQAHSAPLGIALYQPSRHGFPKRPSGSAVACSGGFPATMRGDAFVAFHGSWNRNPPTGYKVRVLAFGAQGLGFRV
jgi:glucose/arabinose dehydrogenase